MPNTNCALNFRTRWLAEPHTYGLQRLQQLDRRSRLDCVFCARCVCANTNRYRNEMLVQLDRRQCDLIERNQMKSREKKVFAPNVKCEMV